MWRRSAAPVLLHLVRREKGKYDARDADFLMWQANSRTTSRQRIRRNLNRARVRIGHVGSDFARLGSAMYRVCVQALVRRLVRPSPERR